MTTRTRRSQHTDPSADLLDITDLLRLYRSEITHIQRTSPEEEQRLVASLGHHETTDAHRLAEQAKCRMVEANLRFVYALARKYEGKGFDVMDIIQEGNIALIHAVEKYDPQKGKFSTYAGHWVAKAIFRALGRQIHMITIPEYKRVEIRRLQRTQHTLEQTQQGANTEDLAAHLQVSQRQVRALVSTLQVEYEKAQSLDTPISDAEQASMLSDILEDDPRYAPEEEVAHLVLQERIRDLLTTTLTPLERKIITLRFGLDGGEPHSLNQVAKRRGVTHQAISDIEMRALKKLTPLCQDLHDYL